MYMTAKAATFEQAEEQSWIPLPEGICPLCSQVFALELLQKPIASENTKSRERTVQVIQVYHPHWLEEHGACTRCWESYREAGWTRGLIKISRR